MLKIDGGLYITFPDNHGGEKISDDGLFEFGIDDLNEIQKRLSELSKEELDTAQVHLVVFDAVETDTDTNTTPVDERVKQQNKDTLLVSYDIPKKIAFTQKFQDRIRTEIPDVIDSVYHNLYDIKDISFIEDSTETIKLNIKVKCNTPDAVRNQDYLNDNIGYIVDNIIKYYTKNN